MILNTHGLTERRLIFDGRKRGIIGIPGTVLLSTFSGVLSASSVKGLNGAKLELAQKKGRLSRPFFDLPDMLKSVYILPI